jgi:DNA-binding response OmpR family regulator
MLNFLRGYAFDVSRLCGAAQSRLASGACTCDDVWSDDAGCKRTRGQLLGFAAHLISQQTFDVPSLRRKTLAKRRILLVDDEVTVLLTLKAVLEISGYDVDTAASAREGKSKIKLREYQMVITDMRMESDAAGREVIQAARNAAYHPAVALLTAFPVADDDWQDMGADKMLVKPMQTRMLIQSIEKLMEKHAAKLARLAGAASSSPLAAPPKAPVVKKAVKAPAKKAAKKVVAKKVVAKKAAKKTVAKKAKK